MLAGADLIRRKEGKDAFAMTFPLLTNSEGKKMGKTASGAVWLSAEKTSPYDFYQYWRNVEDSEVRKCMKLLTFMPLDEIEEMTAHQDERINAAKERLAYEITKIVHGEEIANDVVRKVKAAFSGDTENMPTREIPASMTKIVDILAEVGFAPSKSEARRLVQGGAVSADGVKITDVATEVTDSQIANGFLLSKGKKNRLKITFSK